MSDTLTGSISVGESVTNSYSSTSESTNSTELDSEAFLSLLLTELQYQDPLEPMDTTEMVGQLAQLSTVEQLTNLNTTVTNSAAYSLVGKYVTATYYDSSTYTTSTVEGYVDSVKVSSSGTQLVIGDDTIDYDDVTGVYDTETDYTESINGNIVSSQALSLVGQYIQAITVDDDGNADEYVEGTVDYVTFVDEVPVLHVGTKEVYLSDVMTVGEGSQLLGNTVTYTASSSSSDDEEDTDATGEIESIEIDGDTLYLVVDGQKIEIADLSSLMTAYSLVGQTIDLGEVSGEITGVSVRETVPYVIVGDGEAEVKYSTAADAV